jgi:hypothetical protein
MRNCPLYIFSINPTRSDVHWESAATLYIGSKGESLPPSTISQRYLNAIDQRGNLSGSVTLRESNALFRFHHFVALGEISRTNPLQAFACINIWSQIKLLHLISTLSVDSALNCDKTIRTPIKKNPTLFAHTICMTLNSWDINIVPERFVCWHRVSPKYSYLLLFYRYACRQSYWFS